MFGGHDAGRDAARARPIASKREYPRILRELECHAAVRSITVRIWQDETTSYFNELTRYFGMRYQRRPATSPDRPSCGCSLGGNLNTNVVHEFVHAVSHRREPAIRQQPALVLGDGRAL